MSKLKNLLTETGRYFSESRSALSFSMRNMQQARALLCPYERSLINKLKELTEIAIPFLKTSHMNRFKEKHVSVTQDGAVNVRIIYSVLFENDEMETFHKKLPVIKRRFKRIAGKILELPQDMIEADVWLDDG